MVQKIVQSGEKKLRLVSKPVEKIDKKTIKLIQDLKDTLSVQTDPEGVGLAAPQIGVNLRVFYTKYKDFEKVVINPEIIEISEVKEKKSKAKTKSNKSKKEILEGCLSLPHYYGPLQRPSSIKLKYMNEAGESLTETITGFNAQIIFHEIDHLNGILFVDRLLEQGQSLYKLTPDDEWEEVDL